MKHLILAISILATPALSAEPATLVLPTPVIAAIGNYLNEQPYGKVASMVVALQHCIAVQVPTAQGVIIDHGECPAVTAALTKQVTDPPVKNTKPTASKETTQNPKVAAPK